MTRDDDKHGPALGIGDLSNYYRQCDNCGGTKLGVPLVIENRPRFLCDTCADFWAIGTRGKSIQRRVFGKMKSNSDLLEK